MTKQLNKKGTSLVELIAVIVIMGIIAGIAIPTTIAVINRQKRNAAAKSAESLVSTLKNILTEAGATNSGEITATASYASAGAAGTLTFAPTTVTGFGDDDINIDNFKGVGALSITFNTASGSFTYGGTSETLQIDGFYIVVDTDGSCSAVKSSSAVYTRKVTA